MLRFTIRDVLWLTVVVAMAMAWWIGDNRAKAAFKAERRLLTQKALAHEGNSRMWHGRAEAVAHSMKCLGIIVEFNDDTKGMSYGPLPQYILDHDRKTLKSPAEK